MQPCVLVSGYGVPKNILKDGNYEIYLRTVFNRLVELCQVEHLKTLAIVFTGGKTDMFKPYQRSEAEEMIKAFRVLMERPSVKHLVGGWKLIAEARALSSLDNALYAKELCDKRGLALPLVIFAEQTRVERVKRITKTVFGKKTKVQPIDFDQSANRYVSTDLLEKREHEGMKLDAWALKSQENLKRHRALYKQKIAFLRGEGPAQHVEALQTWWNQQIEQLNEKSLR